MLTLKKRYTVVVIPEVGKAVIRFRLPRFVLFLVPLLILALTASLYILNHAYEKNVKTLSALEEKLALTETNLTNTIIHKNEEIEVLQSEIISLSEQAEEIRSKVEALKSLEAELRGLTNQDQPLTNNNISDSDSVTISSTQSSTDLSQYYDTLGYFTSNMGGEWFPVNNEDILALADTTASEFATLGPEMDSLNESMQEAKEAYMSYQHILSITPSIYPTTSKKVTSTFGYRQDPFTGRLSEHTGIDFAGDYGSKVMATADGTVTQVGYDSVRGYHVVIDHGAGIQTRYFHLSKYTVAEGQQVSRYDQIGNLGSTGRSTGPHLHYEVIKNGNPVDPEPYLTSSS